MIARVFPRRTRMTPTDGMAFTGAPGLFPVKASEVHISVLFDWDIDKAEWLKRQWQHIAPVKMGGPAYGKPSGEFVPGMYVKDGATITSRGCPNKCWFCSVWKREPGLIELPIYPGRNVLDDNLLACSEKHVVKVFEMLCSQTGVEFTGGLEAKLLKPWHIDWLLKIKPKQMFFAYDTPDDYEPLVNASKLLRDAGFNRNKMRCYVLIGYSGDTFEKAENRLRQTLALGYFPMAMLYRGKPTIEWRRFQRAWARPAIISQIAKDGE